jgi:flagella basal body P-ring formation protein FlgA
LTIRGRNHDVRVSESVTEIRPGNFSLPIELLADGRVEQHCIVSVKVRTYDSVLVATRQLGRHENLTSEDVRKERVETTSLRGEALTRTDQLEGVRTSRILSSGTVLTSDLTEPVPLVVQGSQVVLIVQGQGVRFSTDAIARQDGRRGERIMVQRAGSSARLQAMVIDAKTVQMVIQ